jgi:uncharacterized membrane protein
MLGAVDAYSILKALHVLAAIVWVGGAVTVNILGTRVVATKDGVALARFGRDTEWVGTHVYLPCSFLVLLSGVLAVVKGHYGFGHGWVIFGIVGIVLTGLTGSLFFGPELKRIAALTEKQGPNDPEVIERTSRLIRIGRVDLMILTLVVIDMVLKPGS